MGATDLDGRAQVLEGIESGARVVVYSVRSLGAHTRVKLVEHLPGVTP